MSSIYLTSTRGNTCKALKAKLVQKDEEIEKLKEEVHDLNQKLAETNVDADSWYAEMLQYKAAVKEQVGWKCAAQKNFTDKVVECKRHQGDVEVYQHNWGVSLKEIDMLRKQEKVIAKDLDLLRKREKDFDRYMAVAKKDVATAREEREEAMGKYKLTQERLASVCRSKDNWKISAKKHAEELIYAQDVGNIETSKKRKAEALVNDLMGEAQQLDKEVFLETYKKQRNAKNLSAVLAMTPAKFAALHARVNGLNDVGVTIVHDGPAE